MDATHIHLILTHVPIVGTLIGIGILAYGYFSKNDDIKKVSLMLLFLMALVTIPVFISGEKAEHSVEHLAGVSEVFIEEHEELAEKAIWLMGLMGLLSISGFIALQKNLPFAKILTMSTLVVSLLTFGIFAKVGNLGGQIRHSEIRDKAQTMDEQKEPEIEKNADDDDDENEQKENDDLDNHH